MTIDNSLGVVVGPRPVFQPGWGHGIYAEVYPATPLRLRGGRRWREAHIRWWFEVSSDKSPSTGEPAPWDRLGTHFWQHDGGAITLAGAVRKAVAAIHKCADELDDTQSRRSATSDLAKS